MSKSRSKVWFRFTAPSGLRWTVYFSLRRKHPSYFAGKENVGATWWSGRYKHRIYIDASMPWDEICRVTVHEIMHVVMRPLGLSRLIDEVIVDQVSEDFSYILLQVLPLWPELE